MGNANRRSAIHHRMIRKGGNAQMVVKRLIAEGKTGAAVEQFAGPVRRSAFVAEEAFAGGAARAFAAGGKKRQHDPVADGEGRIVRCSQCLDGPDGFVAKHHRHRPRPVAVDHRQVGVAKPGSIDPHQELACAGRRERHLLQPQCRSFRIRAGEPAPFKYGCPDLHAKTAPDLLWPYRSGRG